MYIKIYINLHYIDIYVYVMCGVYACIIIVRSVYVGYCRIRHINVRKHAKSRILYFMLCIIMHLYVCAVCMLCMSVCNGMKCLMSDVGGSDIARIVKRTQNTSDINMADRR